LTVAGAAPVAVGQRASPFRATGFLTFDIR